MNILIISFSVNGAMGDNFKQVIKMLSDNDDANLYILTNKNLFLDHSKKNNICKIDFDRKKLFSFINPFSYYKIWKYIKKSKYDKVLFCSPHPANILIHKWIDDNKVFYYLHDNEPHSGFPKLDLFFYKYQLDYIYNSDCKIIASSNLMREEILVKRPKTNPSKIFVIYLGCLENLQFKFEDDYLIETNDILFFGRLEYYKGLDVLIEANNYTKKKYNYLLISKGDLEKVYKINTLPDNFKHINEYVSDNDLAKHIKKSKIIVMPYRDATGTQVIQTGFYYEKPIIATNVGCFPEYISNSIDGIIVEKENPKELANAIDILMMNDELRKGMGSKGKEKINTIFSNDSISKKYFEIFKY